LMTIVCVFNVYFKNAAQMQKLRISDSKILSTFGLEDAST